jgi:hypothetical protein
MAMRSGTPDEPATICRRRVSGQQLQRPGGLERKAGHTAAYNVYYDMGFVRALALRLTPVRALGYKQSVDTAAFPSADHPLAIGAIAGPPREITI